MMRRRRLLFLCHRIPYPPNKGEKIRAWHMLAHLAERWDVDLGCLVDDPADLEHCPILRERCAEVECRTIRPYARTARTLLSFRPNLPLTLGWFHEPGLRVWVESRLAARGYDAALAYSSAMAPYLMGVTAQGRGLRRVLDMVDVDSEKWRAYAAAARGPAAAVWARESRTLLGFERRAAAEFDRTLFVSEEEKERFADLAPECAERLGWVDNGVDLRSFAPSAEHPDPFMGDAPALVFTGTMDYRPNIDAVCWFAREVMPLLRTRRPAPRFHIVGANPGSEVEALTALPDVRVTGRVPDVRPYLAHAAVAVVPLRIARGIQNKLLEAMAIGRPAVASPQAFEGVHARPGRDLLVADGADEMARRVAEVLDGAHPGLGAAARAAVVAGHDWAGTLLRLDRVLEPAAHGAPAPAGHHRRLAAY